MMRRLFILLMAAMSLTGFAKTNETKSATPIQKPMLKSVNFDELKTILNKNDNKLYVVNFWATWCTPCVKELPDFMKVNKSYSKDLRFKMILVSLDLANEMESRVKPFLLKNNIDADVYILDDNKRMNEWIPAIDAKWTGAIPATVLYRNGKKLEFREGSLPKNELEQIINKHL